jgi:glycosyltransferase involved in cell wall biosynthesis
LKNQNIFYWSPSLVKIATNQAVIQSASAINKYDRNLKPTIINFFGEFQDYENEISKNKINILNFYNKKIFNILPRHGFFQSRISFIIIFILGILPLHNLIKKMKPEFLIIHLITSLPLFLVFFFKYETKFILRISGFPKLNFLRKLLWKLTLKKIYKITCPTNLTKNYLISLNIVDKKKIYVLQDPVLDVNKSRKLKEQNHDIKVDNYLFAAGRLTKQKNFELLIDGFNKIQKNYPKINLVIAGDGELKKQLISKINNLNLNNKVHLVGFKNNILNYMKNSQGFILTSLWEDPGFVLIEAAFCRSPIVTSDCHSGPKEIIDDDSYAYIFKSGDLDDFIKTLDIFLKDLSDNKSLINSKKIKLLKKVNIYTKFRHFIKLRKILKN